MIGPLTASTPGAVIVRVTRARSGLPTAETCSSGTVWTGVVGSVVCDAGL